MTYSLDDHHFMALAINLAKKGRFTTTPNPNVGCVIVKNHHVIGQGWHKKAGSGHAEVNALAGLSVEQTSNATVYVTLEPCSHYGRTPPCAERLIEAKVARVVVAKLDPNPLVAGNGIKLLEQAGIEVSVGLLEQDATALNVGFFSRMENKCPFVQVKMAASLDGKSALGNGDSKWITGAEARADVQTHRALSCAILSTANTAIADNAKLNVRKEQLNFDYPFDDEIETDKDTVRQPIKIILDSQGLLNKERQTQLALFDDSSQVIICRKDTDSLTTKSESNVKYIQLPYHTNDSNGFHGFDINALLDWCGSNGINHLWVEAGATLAASFVEQQLFDELIVYIAPKLMGKHAQDVMPIGPFDAMDNIVQLQLKAVTQLGQDLRLNYVRTTYNNNPEV